MSRLYYDGNHDRLFYDEDPSSCKLNPNWLQKLYYLFESVVLYSDD